MNRRGFIGKAIAALAFLKVRKSWAYEPGKDMATGSYTVTGVEQAEPIKFVAAPEPRRRVLVLTKWYETFDGKPGTAVYSRDSFSYAHCITPWKHPRYAAEWHEIEFEELKKGDHFRLIDELQITWDGTKAAGSEDGKTVSIALSDATLPPTGNPEEVYVTIDPKLSYPGKGAGFDWYDLEWPYSMHSLQPIAASNPRSPRTFPYSFERDDKGYAIIKEGTR